ncbi:MAG TPA: LacI family DNA-binding transcriptional regulator [Beijerinckiaceae bacterium]|jgi:LacI family transcriptional regulator|nr:LacI family DNA-binding transcriptional regulator [Beijerinckiaceae bacterium]
MHQRRTTIKDIAVHLGIDHSTVSRALNDNPNISEETKHQVRQAALRLGYVANASARAMRYNHNALIGLAIPDIRNDFYSAVARALAERCNRAGFQMVLVNTDDHPEVEYRQVRALMEARVAGVLITPTPELLDTTAKLLAPVPTVQFVRQSPKLSGDIVRMDDTRAMREATEHLLAQGHKRIGYVGTRKDINVGQARLNGYLEAHAAAGLTVDERYLALVSPRQTFGSDSVARLLAVSPAPTALIIGSSELTIGGLGAIQAAGLTIPRELAVVGYGDPVWCRLLSPSLTAVQLPVDEMVEAAEALILDRIGGKAPAGADVRSCRPTLVVRGSTAT